jgi:hypothetical protein
LGHVEIRWRRGRKSRQGIQILKRRQGGIW